MKIGIVQRDDTRSMLTSSGTIYSMGQSLARHVGEVVHLGPDTSLLSKAYLKGGQLLNTVSEPIVKRRLSPIHQHRLATHASRIFTPRIAAAGCDVLYAPFASVEIAELTTSTPIVYHTDMTWAQALNYYSIYSGLFGFARKEGEVIQRAALERAAASFFPSTWAAESAITDYGIDPAKVSVVSYGANFNAKDVPPAEEALKHNLGRGINLLWIGVDWNRKGGLVAYECLVELLAQGVDARLVVCGCTPPGIFSNERMKVIPFLDKSDPEQRKALSQLFLDANFFLFPTLKEAAAIVLCEASAHGLPSIVRNTGGLSSVVLDGVNGCLLPENAGGKEFAEKVRAVIADGTAYARLVEGSRREYEERLNWDAWGRAVKPLFEQAIYSTAK